MTCSARSFGSASSSAASSASCSGVAPRGRVPAIGCISARPSVDLDQRLRRRSRPRRGRRSAAGTCTATGSRCAARGRRRAGRRRVCISKRWRHHDLEESPARMCSLAALDRRPCSPPCVRALLELASAGRTNVATDGLGRLRQVGGHRRRAGRRRRRTPPSGSVSAVRRQPRITLAISRIEPSRWSSTARSVASRKCSSGRSEVVLGQRRQPLHPADGVVAEVADQTAGQRRQVRAAAACAAAPPRRRSASSGSSGWSSGPVPVQTAWPSCSESVRRATGPRRRSSATTRRRARPTPAGRCPTRPAASLR